MNSKFQKKSIYVVIGHRGSGKTTWAQALAKAFNKKTLFLDLDQEIKKKTKKSIGGLFSRGEPFFRKKENECFIELLNQAKRFRGDVFISVGAGFRGKIPSFCRGVHLKRPSDPYGRIFFNRPRLKPSLSPLEEFQSFYKKRQDFYKKQRDFVFVKSEYVLPVKEGERVFFGLKALPFKNAVLTLKEDEIKNTHLFFNQKLKYGLKYFELRDDLLSKNFLEKIINFIPPEKRLFSFRKKRSSLFKPYIHDKKSVFDWPCEWGENKKLKPNIYSLHTRKKGLSFKKQLKEFSKLKNSCLKLAVPIHSFEELCLGHEWQRAEPKNRSFHPCSKEGRWLWHRLLFGPGQALYFIREDDEGVLDRPLLDESILFHQGILKKGFASVLGDPIWHSATPFEQSRFFKKYGLQTVKILMKEEEMTLKNILLLEKLGMRFAAVTSPLKKKAARLFKNAERDESINTLILSRKKWQSFNTDKEGLQSLLQSYPIKNKKTVVWGGGAMRDLLKKEIPWALFYSARTGQALTKKHFDKPEILIWAVGRGRMPPCLFPPKSFKPEIVLDLHYTECSPGREYALKTGARYISGWSFFKAQAASQRKLFQTLKK